MPLSARNDASDFGMNLLSTLLKLWGKGYPVGVTKLCGLERQMETSSILLEQSLSLQAQLSSVGRSWNYVLAVAVQI